MWQANQTIKDGRFLIQAILGSGGFGVAYRAEDRKERRQVVIKTLNQRQQNQADFAEQQEKFMNEAMRLKGFEHPHIVKVYELIQVDGLLGMVMEYIDGQELAEYVEEKGKLTESQALKYIKQVGEALIYIHEKRFLHRDIKPHNIMLRAGSQEAVLIDFGLARGYIDGKTLSMTNSHTPAYAPIEQYDRHGRFGAYTDIYALAATLYHLLTGQPPLPSNYRKLNYPLSLPKSLNPDISSEVENAIVKGLELYPRDRPQTMVEFLQLLGLEIPSISNKPTSSTSIHPATTPNPLDIQVQALSIPEQELVEFLQLLGLEIPSTPDPVTVAPPRVGFRARIVPPPPREILKLDAQDVLAAFRQGRRKFNEIDMSSLDLSKAYLPSITLNNSNCAYINFQGANLSAGKFEKADLSGAVFKDAILINALFSYANLQNADLRGADLNGAYLNYANLNGANFCGANLKGVKVSEEQLAQAKTNFMTVFPNGKRGGFW
jgi:serine/threonine protein kinase